MGDRERDVSGGRAERIHPAAVAELKGKEVRRAKQTAGEELEQQVAQIGNYANINNLPGVSTIGRIVGDGMNLYRQGTGIYGQIHGLTNPGQFVGQFQALLSRYGNYQNLLNSVTTYGPVSNQYTIPMATAQAVNGYKNALGTLN